MQQLFWQNYFDNIFPNLVFIYLLLRAVNFCENRKCKNSYLGTYEEGNADQNTIVDNQKIFS